MRKVSIACVVGARPNFMKIAPILAEMATRPGLSPWLVHTGQHSSPEMAESFFHDLGIPRPEVSLEISGGTSNSQTARVMQALEPLFTERRPDAILVVGDVNATIAAALVGAKLGIPVAHVEAGLRSFDRTMPEEINRIVTDALSNFLFTTERSAHENLIREGVPEERIFFCGNVMIDTLLRFRDRAGESDVLQRLGIQPQSYAVVTLHRPANVDEPQKLGELIAMLDKLSAKIPVVFPMHPRTRNTMSAHGIQPTNGVIGVPPQNYIDFLKLLADARLVLTDSGGIQEETTILGVPCLTVRENTERPVTITDGTNRLAGTDPDKVLEAALEILGQPLPGGRRPELWDGQAAGRIVDVLTRVL